MAVIPLLVVAWSLAEFAWNIQTDPRDAERIIRVMAGTWMMLGPAALHVFSEFSGPRYPTPRRLVPVFYGGIVLALVVHNVTDWAVTGVTKMPWGWGIQFDPGFLLMYAALAAPIAYALFRWGQIIPDKGFKDERRIWSKLYMSVVVTMTVATVTDVFLPALGVPFPPIASTAVLVCAAAIAYQFKKNGYALMAPGAFASEILESLSDGVVLLESNGDVRFANAAFQRLVGASEEQIRSAPFGKFAPGVDVTPASLTKAFECELVSCSGESVPVLIAPTRLHNPSGKVRGAAMSIRDLREVSALRGDLVVSDRLATVGGLSASVAAEIKEPIHETRNHLMSARLRLASLRDAVSECESTEKLCELVQDREELLEECLEGIARIEAIMRDVRGFASEESGPREAVDINRLIEKAQRIALTRAGTAIEIERTFDSLLPVQCVPGEIVQVLVNLIANAVHATAGTGRVQLASWQHDRDVWICIEDNGYGVPADVISRIFDPFFTTKPVGDGTGLGLAISHSIIRNHGGELRVESEPGRGARFTIVLPIDPDRLEPKGTATQELSR
jgi:signal transduction histidine kinase